MRYVVRRRRRGRCDFVPAATGINLSDYSVVVSQGILTVTKAASSLAFSTSASEVAPGSLVTFTAKTKSNTTGMPTGTVVFSSGSTQLGTATLNAQGIASLAVTTLPVGSNTITASYSGDTNFTGSRARLSGSVVIGNPSFNMTVSPGSLTIQLGQAGIATVKLTPTLGYAGTVNFSCSQLPKDSNCHFQPSSVTLSGSGSQVQVTLAIQIGTQSSARTHQVARLHAARPLRSLPVLPAMFFWLPGTKSALENPEHAKRKRKRKSRAMLWLIALIAIGAGALGIAGCAGLAPSYPPAGQQTITVIALGSSRVNQYASVNVTIR